MKYVFLFLLLLVAEIPGLNACTTFFINKNGQLVFGRNYDWVTDVGLLCKNARGLAKSSLQAADGGKISWVSKYGSLTFNQYGKEFPTGGMNEKGLVVELMWLDGSQYPRPDGRASVNVLEWIQFQLDNCTTVDEVIATDKRIRIASSDNPPLHYLVADAMGRAATIEFLDGKMVVHKGKDLPLAVLTNTDYTTSLNVVKNTKAGAADGNYSDNSIDRFAKACTMVKQFYESSINKSVIDYSFDVLQKVAQPGWTRWSIVYDITNKTIYFKTARFMERKSISFSDLDFNCSSSSLALDINQPLRGNVIKEFKPLTKEINRKLIQQAFEESKSQVKISEEIRKRKMEYAESVTCK